MDTLEFMGNTYYALRSREEWLEMMKLEGFTNLTKFFKEPKEYPCIGRAWNNGSDSRYNWAEEEYLYRTDVEEMVATLQNLL